MEKPFKNRREAGRKLAQELLKYRGENTIVLALPRGGVPVAFEVAQALDVPLEVLMVRKLGAPRNPELGVGAISEGGQVVVDRDLARMAGVTGEDLQEAADREAQEIQRQIAVFRPDRHPPNLRGKTVIIVDDGLATGITALAAIRYARAQKPAHIIVAVPVCAKDTAEHMRREADEVICLSEPEYLGAVGAWYQDFHQVPDEEVISLFSRV